MKFILLISLIFAIISTSLSAVSRGFYADPENPGKCVVQGLVLSPGEKVRDPQNCAKITCYENSEASTVTCGLYVPPVGCTLGEPVHPSAMYPQCCKRKMICSDGNTFST